MNIRATVGVAACAVALALLADPAEATAKKFTVTAKVSTAEPKPGAKVAFTGTVKKRAKKKVVRLQRQDNGTWRTVATARTSSASRYTIKLAPPKGTSYYRICKPRTARTKGGCSRTLKVRPLTYKWLYFRTNPYRQGDYEITDATVVLGKSYPNSFEARLRTGLGNTEYPSLHLPLNSLCDKVRLGLAYVRDGELPGGTGSMYLQRSGTLGGTPAIMRGATSPTVLWFDDIDVRGVKSVAIHGTLGPNNDKDGKDWPVIGILSPQAHCLSWPPPDI